MGTNNKGNTGMKNWLQFLWHCLVFPKPRGLGAWIKSRVTVGSELKDEGTGFCGDPLSAVPCSFANNHVGQTNFLVRPVAIGQG